MKRGERKLADLPDDCEEECDEMMHKAMFSFNKN